MKVRILYDGACPFCDDYVRYQKLRAGVDTLELVDARSRPEVLREHNVSHADLEDGMVVIADGKPYHGAHAMHLLATISEPPRKWWVRAVAAVSRSLLVARVIYPALKIGRRIALTILGVPRFPRG